MNRFTYFDFIAYIVPGALLLGTIAVILDVDNFPLITKNPAIDTLLFLIISFTVGALFHQLSRYSVEPLVKRLFWHGKFYSDIYLVERYGLCQDPIRTQILNTAKSLCHFDSASLSSLDNDTNKKASPSPFVVSHQVFRCLDSYTMDHGLAKKSHLANAFYSLYRSMTLVTLILGILFAVSYRWDASTIGPTSKVVFAASSFVASLVFLFRTRNEGQRYVEGVFSSASGQ